MSERDDEAYGERDGSTQVRLANGEAIDVAEHAQLSSTIVRLASRIGINGVAKNVTPTVAEQ